MTSVATIWWPSLDLVGPASVGALAAVSVAWMLMELPALERFQRQIVGVASILFVAFVYVSAAPLVGLNVLDVWHLKYKRFPDYSDYVANYIVIAVGLTLAIKVRKRARHVAIGFGVVFVGLIAAEVCALFFSRW